MARAPGSPEWAPDGEDGRLSAAAAATGDSPGQPRVNDQSEDKGTSNLSLEKVVQMVQGMVERTDEFCEGMEERMEHVGEMEEQLRKMSEWLADLDKRYCMTAEVVRSNQASLSPYNAEREDEHNAEVMQERVAAMETAQRGTADVCLKAVEDASRCTGTQAEELAQVRAGQQRVNAGLAALSERTSSAEGSIQELIASVAELAADLEAAGKHHADRAGTTFSSIAAKVASVETHMISQIAELRDLVRGHQREMRDMRDGFQAPSGLQEEFAQLQQEVRAAVEGALSHLKAASDKKPEGESRIGLQTEFALLQQEVRAVEGAPSQLRAGSDGKPGEARVSSWEDSESSIIRRLAFVEASVDSARKSVADLQLSVEETRTDQAREAERREQQFATAERVLHLEESSRAHERSLSEIRTALRETHQVDGAVREARDLQEEAMSDRLGRVERGLDDSRRSLADLLRSVDDGKTGCLLAGGHKEQQVEVERRLSYLEKFLAELRATLRTPQEEAMADGARAEEPRDRQSATAARLPHLEERLRSHERSFAEIRAALADARQVDHAVRELKEQQAAVLDHLGHTEAGQVGELQQSLAAVAERLSCVERSIGTCDSAPVDLRTAVDRGLQADEMQEIRRAQSDALGRVSLVESHMRECVSAMESHAELVSTFEARHEKCSKEVELVRNSLRESVESLTLAAEKHMEQSGRMQESLQWTATAVSDLEEAHYKCCEEVADLRRQTASVQEPPRGTLADARELSEGLVAQSSRLELLRAECSASCARSSAKVDRMEATLQAVAESVGSLRQGSHADSRTLQFLGGVLADDATARIIHGAIQEKTQQTSSWMRGDSSRQNRRSSHSTPASTPTRTPSSATSGAGLARSGPIDSLLGAPRPAGANIPAPGASPQLDGRPQAAWQEPFVRSRPAAQAEPIWRQPIRPTSLSAEDGPRLASAASAHLGGASPRAAFMRRSVSGPTLGVAPQLRSEGNSFVG